jgi:hypothetical protein
MFYADVWSGYWNALWYLSLFYTLLHSLIHEFYGCSKLLASNLKKILKRTGRVTETSCCPYNLSLMYCRKIIGL